MSTQRMLQAAEARYKIYVFTSITMTTIWIAIVAICLWIGILESFPFFVIATVVVVTWFIYAKIYRDVYKDF